MDFEPFDSRSDRKSWTDRFQAFIEILLVSGLVSGIAASYPLSFVYEKDAAALLEDAIFMSIYLFLEAGITFMLLAAVLKLRRETVRGLGLQWNRWKCQSISGLAIVPFLFIINFLITFIFKIYLPQYYIERNPLTEMIRTPQQLVLFIFSALVAGGIKEELQRAFILRMFSRYLGGAGVGLVLWSLAFGAGHYVQGVQGIVLATIYGFIFGVVYLLSGSLIAPIVAHSVYDTLALLGHWFFSGRS
ncbi:MAG: type II CAAX endopeptidase family protein [candidate division WOR-3 bacterium]